jgi:crotonobetainyl-CoA hydratase
MAPLPASGFGGLTRRFDLPKPIVAAVNGDALDEGFELVLACDLVVANEDARFAMQQGLWGRAPVEGGVQRLVRQIPLKKAMAALLTGAPLSAAEGVLLGFVNDITGFDQVVPLARQWADRIQKLSPRSVRAIKQSAMLGLEKGSLAEACGAEYPELKALLDSKEYEDGVDRMLRARNAR